MQKIFIFALFLRLIMQGVSSTNLALNRTAYQSSTWWPAGEAVDGISDTNHMSNLCTHTDLDTNPWWAVDLGDVYHVTSVTITNRGDCCGSRLGDFNIGLMNFPPTEVAPEPTGVYDTIYYHPGPMGSGQTVNFPSSDESISGRYLVIQLLKASEHLTLCEVEVFGYAAGTNDSSRATTTNTTSADATTTLATKRSTTSSGLTGTVSAMMTSESTGASSTSPAPTMKESANTKKSGGDTYNVNITAAVAAPISATLMLAVLVACLILFVKKRNDRKNRAEDLDNLVILEPSRGVTAYLVK